MEHMKEPWRVFTVYAHPEIRDADDAFIAALSTGDVITARRIVACVNACAGISTERLEKFLGVEANKSVITLTTDNIDLKKQRDELLSILKYIAPILADPVDSRLVEEVIASVGCSAA